MDKEERKEVDALKQKVEEISEEENAENVQKLVFCKQD